MLKTCLFLKDENVLKVRNDCVLMSSLKLSSQRSYEELRFVNDRWRWQCVGRCVDGDGLHTGRCEPVAGQDDRDRVARARVDGRRSGVGSRCALRAAAPATSACLNAGSTRPHQDQHQSLRPDTGITHVARAVDTPTFNTTCHPVTVSRCIPTVSK